VVDRITLAPSANWIPLVHYREPKRGDVVVFIKPVPDLTGDWRAHLSDPGEAAHRGSCDHIRLRNGIVILNGVAQTEPTLSRRRRTTIWNLSTSFLHVPVSEPAT